MGDNFIKHVPNPEACQKILAVLKQGPKTKNGVVEATGIGEKIVVNCLTDLINDYKATKKVHGLSSQTYHYLEPTYRSIEEMFFRMPLRGRG